RDGCLGGCYDSCTVPVMVQRSEGRSAGFTLIELMVVVVIIGVLASIAVPAFQSYVMRARAAEAPTFLGEIRQRQESYRAEFGQYATAAAFPVEVPEGEIVAWDPPEDSGWRELGASPDGPVRFQYETLSGLPGTTPPGGLGYDGSDFWFIAHATGNLDGDEDTVLFEAYSASNKIWVSEQKGWE
ncbi:MAG: type IV pilin protein, partial [Myxococcota bacterium]